MLRFVVTSMDYDTMVRSSRVWGSAYYVAWSLFMILILANVFIAILAEAFAQVSEELSVQDKVSMGSFGMAKAFNKVAQN